MHDVLVVSRRGFSAMHCWRVASKTWEVFDNNVCGSSFQCWLEESLARTEKLIQRQFPHVGLILTVLQPRSHVSAREREANSPYHYTSIDLAIVHLSCFQMNNEQKVTTKTCGRFDSTVVLVGLLLLSPKNTRTPRPTRNCKLPTTGYMQRRVSK